MTRLSTIIPTGMLRSTIAALSLSVLVATVTATLLSPTSADAAAIAPARQALGVADCSDGSASPLQARKAKAQRSETKRSDGKARKTKKASGKKSLQGSLNINNATTEQLSLLPGVGPAKAERVVSYRERHGKFRRVKDLRRVKGFGYKSLKKLKKWLSTKGKTTLELRKAAN